MTDLEALHWLRRMKATVVLDDGHVRVIVARDRGHVHLDEGRVEVHHSGALCEVTATTLADATWQALQAWRAGRGAVDAIADLATVPSDCCNILSRDEDVFVARRPKTAGGAVDG